MNVLKRDGRRQKYSNAKLERAVERAAKDAKLSAARRRELAREVAAGVRQSLRGRRVVKVVEIRRRALTRLDNRSKKVANAWRRYDKRKRR